MTTHELLVKARNNAAAGACVTNATFRAGGFDMAAQREAHRVLLAALGYVPRLTGSAMLNILRRWHDSPDRTRAEVLALFDKVIAATAPEPDTAFLSEVREEVTA